MILIRRIASQQVCQCRSPRLVHGGANRCLGRFQVQVASLAMVLEDEVQQSVYFAGDFLFDGFRRFFSWVEESIGAMGRKRQICVLISTNC
jgi:hypothetical protein